MSLSVRLLLFVPDDRTAQLLAPSGAVGLVRVRGKRPGLVCDALAVPDCCTATLRAIAQGRAYQTGAGDVQTVPLPGLAALAEPVDGEGPPTLWQSEAGNLSVRFGERLILKRFRRLDEGTNPTVEVGRYLAEQRQFPGIAAVLGHIEYRRPGGEASTLAVLHQFIPNHGNGWQYTLDQLSSFFERVAALSKEQPPKPPPPIPIVSANDREDLADVWKDLIGGYRQTARDLGQRTAELHLALASNKVDPAFTPEPFGRLYQRSVYQSMRNLSGHLFSRLDRVRRTVAEPNRSLIGRLLDLQNTAMERFRIVLDPAMTGWRIRCHGDYQLERFLYTGKEFVLGDFEGEPSRAIDERRIGGRRCATAAASARSPFEYAVQSAFTGLPSQKGGPPGMIRPEDRPTLQPWASVWSNRVSHEFVSAYLKFIEPARLLPSSLEMCGQLLDIFLLERALREIDFELSNRPDWAPIPLRGALVLLGRDPRQPEPTL